MIEARGLIPPSPEKLGGKSLVELLRTGAVRIKVDPKFPQAMGISLILRFVAMLGNFDWEILLNEYDDSPFFTSDFPAAIEETEDRRILNRIVPLTPNVAVRIKPNLSIDSNSRDLSFANFSCSRRHVNHKEIVEINQLIVRCAEDTVFFRDDAAWVKRFVSKNRYYRVEPITYKVPTNTGSFLVSTQKIARLSPASELFRR